ncbi:MAG: penicillin-binding protein 2 [Deltaproteobacteria bacterium]|nr:penicillin-binding protein 2 [Deltaproteobacteria bacterium]
MALISLLSTQAVNRSLRPRFIVAMIATAIAFVVILLRLYTLQVIRGEELASKGERNFVQEVVIPHDRGIIYDRYGRIIVDNRPSFDLQVTPAFLGKRANAEATIARVVQLLRLEESESNNIKEQVFSIKAAERFLPIVVYRDLNAEQVEAIEAERSVFLLDGVDIVEAKRRTYHYGATAAHLLGYVNEIDPQSLEQERRQGNPKKYKLGDYIGRSGIERTYEDVLRGIDGYEKVVVDAKGRRQQDDFFEQFLGDFRRVEPTPGHNIYLTIDIELQQRAEAAFHGKAGAVVALDPRNGAIRAYVSLPSYDPNLIVSAMAKEEKNRIDNDPLKPWLNRPIQGQYAPGSTFKIVTALAALQHQVVSTKEHIFCPGHYRMGNHVWRCHKESGHGSVDINDALKVSCDVYFYTLGARLGINQLADMARHLGYGRCSGIDLPNEKPGLVPDEKYHDRVDAKTGGYQRGMVINTAIGQGSLLVTPLQQAIAYSAIANGGTIYKPQFVERIETADFRVNYRFLRQSATWRDPKENNGLFEGAPLNDAGMRSVEALQSLVHSQVAGNPPMLMQSFIPNVIEKLKVSKEDINAVNQGLVSVVESPSGTGYWHRSKVISMAGKTGTAQVVRLGANRLKAEDMDYFQRDHAWFVAYAPFENSELVVAVLNEHSGHGGSQSEPIAVAIIDAYFEIKAAAKSKPIATMSDSRP